jgi:hypothetical protein
MRRWEEKGARSLGETGCLSAEWGMSTRFQTFAGSCQVLCCSESGCKSMTRNRAWRAGRDAWVACAKSCEELRAAVLKEESGRCVAGRSLACAVTQSIVCGQSLRFFVGGSCVQGGAFCKEGEDKDGCPDFVPCCPESLRKCPGFVVCCPSSGRSALTAQVMP